MRNYKEAVGPYQLLFLPLCTSSWRVLIWQHSPTPILVNHTSNKHTVPGLAWYHHLRQHSSFLPVERMLQQNSSFSLKFSNTSASLSWKRTKYSHSQWMNKIQWVLFFFKLVFNYDLIQPKSFSRFPFSIIKINMVRIQESCSQDKNNGISGR